MTLKIDRVKALLERFPEQRILVLGDLMLDRFIYGRVSRISPEAPVPVVAVRHETDMPGGASNVARNIQSLGGRSIACGFTGGDAEGKILLDLLAGCGVGIEGVMALDAFPTTVKTRVIAEHQQVVRVDWDGPGDYPAGIHQELGARISALIEQCSGAIIEDYGKGVVSQMAVNQVIGNCARLRIPSGLDPKENHDLDARGITVATPNRSEAFHAVRLRDTGADKPPLQDENLLHMAVELKRKWMPELLMVTLGSQGMLLVEDGHPFRHIPTRAREVFDVSGAGDTVIAVCLLAMAAGATHGEAAELANYAAGVVVGKLGTATCSQEELLACFEG